MTLLIFFFFFNDTATTEIYTLSLHDALPISKEPQPIFFHDPERGDRRMIDVGLEGPQFGPHRAQHEAEQRGRSEEHTSELQSRQYLVCRLLLEKKKKYNKQDECLFT